MSEIRYATARQNYICARCHKRIPRGTLYAYALDSCKHRIRYTCICDNRRCRCHRGCAPAQAQYAEARANKEES
jgi:hypothetical protein